MLTKEELLEKIELGESSFVQFKREINDLDSLESELVAFANAAGGFLMVGVDKQGSIIGVEKVDLEKLTQWVANVASQRINPPVYPLTHPIKIDEKILFVIQIKGTSGKPYFTKNGVCWTKVGADKRKVSREELKRLFQSSVDYFIDEQPITKTSVVDLDLAYFSNYYFRLQNETIADSGYELPVLLKRIGITEGDNINLAGLLFFGKSPQDFKPIFHVKAVSFIGNDIAEMAYRDSVNCEGKVETQYRQCLDFLKRNLRYVQNGKSFNSTGDLEISLVALEEALINAFFHRDYTKASPIRVLLFENRLEIISPGSLPNHLTVDNIMFGDTVIRNNRIVSFGSKILPHRGLGSGIRRIVKEHPKTEFINDIDGQQFKVIMHRKS
jgi:ATP-dependent DNA helicase RecG